MTEKQSIKTHILTISDTVAKELQSLIEETLDGTMPNARFLALVELLPALATKTGVPVERRIGKLHI